MLNTAKDMYQYFLSEIRKEMTVVIDPVEWNNFINPIVVDWIKTKLPEREFNQKRIDDLEAIKVLTDGIQYEPIKAYTGIDNVFKLPYDVKRLPKYLSGLSASFCKQELTAVDVDVDDWDDTRMDPLKEEHLPKKNVKLLECIGGRVLRSDKRVIYKNNPFRKGDDKKFIYFEIRTGFLYAYPNELKTNTLVLEYYCYPEEIYFNGKTDKAGSFQPSQNKEIMDFAVSKYLERVSDIRIKTQPGFNASVPK